MKNAFRTSLLVLSFCWATSLLAQSTSVSGVVADPTGAVIPGVKISIENTANGLKRQEVSDNQGRYTFPQLSPGPYKIAAQASG